MSFHPVKAYAGTNLYLTPTTIISKTYHIGDRFNVTFWGENFTDAYTVYGSLHWNTAVLNLTSHYDPLIPGWVPHIWQGNFLEGTGVSTGFLIGGVNYATGTITDITYGRMGAVSGKTGPGPGTIAKVEFTIVGFGDTKLDLYNCNILDSWGQQFWVSDINSPYDCTVRLSELLHHQVIADSQTFWVDTESNSTVTNFGFSKGDYMIYFNVTGTVGLRFCNVSIPKVLLDCTDPSQWIVKINDVAVSRTVGGNSTHSFLYFTYTTSTKMVKIIGDTVIPEFSSFTLIIAMLTAILITLIAAKKFPKPKK